MWDPRVVLTAVVALGAVALAAARRLIEPERPDYAFLLVCPLLLVSIWLPREFRDYALPVLCGVALLIESVEAALITGISIFAVGWFLPGGASAAMLVALAVFGSLVAHESWKHLARMRAAGRLVPGERPRGDVEVGGRARGAQALALPATESTCIAWWVQIHGGPEWSSEAPIRVDTEAGPVIVHPGEVEPDLSEARKSSFWREETRGILAAMGASPDAPELGDDPVVWRSWLEEGDEVYVVGRPVWEAAPAGVADTYRDSPALPTFRAERERKGYVADRAEEAVRRAALWSLWQWAVWGAVFAAIAITQIAVE